MMVFNKAEEALQDEDSHLIYMDFSAHRMHN